MAKWADYLISGIRKSEKNGSKYVSYVMLHVDTDTNFEVGTKIQKADVITLLKSGKKIITIRWDYHKGVWQQGAQVIYETVGNEEFLRTVRDARLEDNLDNLISIMAFNI